jgi:beta-glucan synthesis-associated protein KRE6
VLYDDVRKLLTQVIFQPFNHGYIWFNTSDNFIVYNDSATELNSYIGGAFQQATSSVTTTSESY